MFRLTADEAKAWLAEHLGTRLRSQNVILKRGQHIKHLPYVFTEHGILMLSSVLKSERAIRVNIEIMRASLSFDECSFQTPSLPENCMTLKANMTGSSK
jgi:hypothetical protein